jgi:hypothetical protein
MEGDTGLSARYVRNPDVVLREEDEEGALLYNPDTDQIRVLNGTGLFIWKSCDGGRDVAGLAEAMMQTFAGAPEEKVAAQVCAFVEEMAAAGFLGTMEE